MLDRLTKGWELAKQSWRVLMLDKELLMFPLLSGVCRLLVLGSFAVPRPEGSAGTPPLRSLPLAASLIFSSPAPIPY